MLLHYKTGLSAKSLWIAPPQFFLRVHVDSEKRHSSPCSSHSSTCGKRVGYFQRPRNHEGRRDYPQYLFDTISYYDYREDYYNAFDADEETYLWLDDNGHGKNGAPYHMRDVLDDMEAVEDMIGELLGAIRDVEIDIE